GGTEGMYKLAGLGTGDRVFAPVLRSVGMRFPWLAINLATAFLASEVIALFQGTIGAAKALPLAALVTIPAGQGGNAATQSLTVVIRGLALGELTLREGWKAVGREMLRSLLLGIGIGVLTTAFTYPLYHPPVLLCL